MAPRRPPSPFWSTSWRRCPSTVPRRPSFILVALGALTLAVASQTVSAQSSAPLTPASRLPTNVLATGCNAKANDVPGGPDGSGTCWPGPTNTGVPAGTSLTDYTGPCAITSANTVIDGTTVN